MPAPDWLRKRRERDASADDASLWQKCPKCSEMLYRKDIVANLWVCSRCGYHFRMHAYDRINTLVDGDFVEIGTDILPGDPLGWTDKRPYPQKLERDREKSKLSEAVVTGFATLDGFPVALGVMDFNFRGGTMGTVVGERITNLLEEARRRRLPCIIFTASGGARMEEGMLALMQMAKTTLAVQRFKDEGNLYIAVLTDPTTGGVTASYAMLGDLNISEPGAMIGFAGPRVIEQTVREKLPAGFQRAEFLLENGAIDMIVDRRELRPALVRLLDYAVDRKRLATPLKAVPEFAIQ